MKKLIALLLLVCMTMAFATAETDLSSMTYDELIAIQRKITAEIMSRPEWKEVEVPAGEYIIGEDIPAGSYSISGIDWSVTVKWYEDPNSSSWNYKNIPHDGCIGKITFTEGMKIDLSYRCIFAPPKGLDF